MSPNDNSGRVTTREFYEALLDQNKQRADMEGRLGDKIDGIHSSIAVNTEKNDAVEKRVSKAEGDIKTNSKNIKIVGSIEAGIALALGFLGITKVQ